MTWAALLCVLAMVDCGLTGFRAAAGRDGRIDKRAHYRVAVARSLALGAALVAALAAVGALLVLTAPDAATTWAVFTRAAARLVVLAGAYATLILAAFTLYLAPIGEARVLASVVVFGPLTLARRWMIVLSIAIAALPERDLRVMVMGLATGAAMLAFEPAIGARYAASWRRLVAPR